ncbi:MAG: tRNA lysidine(34) synthetase TilS [Deltaproteobacteria bacterium]|nr:tRNA lysidine(34) synthetase TilS [Deltaproteobacteria bacterium]MBW2360399.1 tRNA lysidine(34) synthetase TilS [Deltaproteobacteria bacterium]
MFLRALSESVERLNLAGGSLLLAVSGGVDSMALLAGLHELSQRYDLKLSIAHVNHGLRASESEADQALVEARAAELGLPCEVSRVRPESLRQGRSSRERPTLQEASRSVRYAALHTAAERRGARHIATAHNLDDQVETVLLRLFRGSGPDGLGGIPKRSPDGIVVRPLLEVSRAEIERFARERRLSWREDASNRSPAYARNRLRAQLPELAAQFNPQILRAIGDLAEALRRDGEWIASAVQREAETRFTQEGAWLVIDAKDWNALPASLSRRLAREALARCGSGRDVTRRHLERVCAFLGSATPGKRIELPGGLLLERRRGDFRLGPGVASGRRTSC